MLGERKPIDDAVAKTIGDANYVDDIRIPGMLHAFLLLSDVAHGEFESIDVEEALAVEGVRAVYSFFNTPDTKYNGAAPFDTDEFPKQESLFSKRIRHQGDRIAMVVATDLKLAQMAAKRIRVSIKILPAVFTIEEARSADAPSIDPDGNFLGSCEQTCGDIDSAKDEADDCFTTCLSIPSFHQAAMEPHGVVAACDDRDGICIYSPTQNIFSARMICAKVLNLCEAQVRVVQPVMGGSFGSKLEIILEPLVAYAAWMLRAPVKLVLNRKQVMVASRRSYGIDARITSYIKNGQWTGLDLEIAVDAGGYCSSGIDFIWAMSAKPFRLYKLPNVRYRAVSVLTNNTTASAMRGYGSTQLITALEHHVDALAASLRMSPGVLRRQYAMDQHGCDLRNGQPFGTIGLTSCIDRGMQAFGWTPGERTEDEHFFYGTSMALGVHGNGMYPVHTDLSTMNLKLNMDGSLVLNTGTVDMGSGANTTLCMLVSEVLGVPLEKIGLQHGDTTACPYDLGCYASRSVYVAGNAAVKVAKALRKKIEIASGKHWDEIGLNSYALDAFCNEGKDIHCQVTHASEADPMSYAAHFARVRVDKVSGEIRVLDYLAAHDVGKVINPMGLEGQIEGAIQMGMGMALTEDLRYDSQGMLLHRNFKKYRLIQAREMPHVQIRLVETLEKTGPYGAKSIGEIAAVPVAATVANAVAVARGKSFSRLPLCRGQQGEADE